MKAYYFRNSGKSSLGMSFFNITSYILPLCGLNNSGYYHKSA